MTTSRDELLKQLSAVDFYIIDLHLYLNTHPEDMWALKTYNEMVMAAKRLREEYQQNYGMLLANNSTSSYPWQWIENPWPWEAKFNFELAGEN